MLSTKLFRLSTKHIFKAKYRMQKSKVCRKNGCLGLLKDLVPIMRLLNLEKSVSEPPQTNGNVKQECESLPEKRHISVDQQLPDSTKESSMFIDEKNETTLPKMRKKALDKTTYEKTLKNAYDIEINERLAPCRELATINRVKFATATSAHLVIACTERRLIIWNILTLRIHCAMKISVAHLALDPLTNLIAVFTKANELYVFPPDVAFPVYIRQNAPDIYDAIWLPRQHPKQRSIHVDWQAQSILYMLTKNQEIVYFSDTHDVSADAPPPVTFLNDAISEPRYSTFGTFAAKQISEKQTKRFQNKIPMFVGPPGQSAVKSLIEMSTHTMPAVRLLSHDFLKTMTPQISSTATKVTNGVNMKNSSLIINGHLTHSDEEEEDTTSAVNSNSQEIRKLLLAAKDSLKKNTAANARAASPSSQNQSKKSKECILLDL